MKFCILISLLLSSSISLFALEEVKENLEVSEEKKVKMPEANPYSKAQEDDPETEAFAKGELTKFHAEQREKKATAETEQKDTDASEETADESEQKATTIAERPAKSQDRRCKTRNDDLNTH